MAFLFPRPIKKQQKMLLGGEAEADGRSAARTVSTRCLHSTHSRQSQSVATQKRSSWNTKSVLGELSANRTAIRLLAITVGEGAISSSQAVHSQIFLVH